MLTLLAEMPIWFSFATLFFLTIGILPLGRRYFEGQPYNIAMSSAYGDVALLVCVMIGITVLQREVIPAVLILNQPLLIGISIAVGIIDGAVIAGGIRKNTVMDNYHNFFVVSLFVYLVVFTAVPAVVLYGTLGEWVGLAIFSMVWGYTLKYDIRTGRVSQCTWLKANGVTQV